MRTVQFRPFVYDAMNRQVPVAIDPMTPQDAALTDREPLWQTSWTSEYLADENYEKYAARVGDELIALAAYEILPTALVVHKLSTVFDDGQLHAGKTTICTAQWERIGNKTEDSSAYYTKADDGTVKIESVDQDELKKQLETDSTAQIDVSGLEAEKVTLPVSAVNDVLDLEAKALSIKMADAAIMLDKTAMQSVVETADGNDIQLHVSTGDALSSDQTEIIGDIEQGMALDVSLTANGTEIHSFNGKVTVSVPFTWTQQGVLQAWYLADDGTKEPVEVAYRDGNAVLTLKHFSIYAIVVKANDPDSGIVSIGENEVTVQKQADAVYYAAALYAEDGRFLAYAASEAAEDEETVTLKWANADWSKAAKVKVFFLDADRKPVAEAVTALIKGKSQKN